MNTTARIIFQSRKTYLRHIKQLRRKVHNEVQSAKLHRANVRKVPYIKVGLSVVIASFVAYDGIINEFTYSGAATRFLRSLKTASLIAVDYLMLEQKQDAENYNELMEQIHQKSADRLLQTCLLNGGLYIKVGQGIASINHILPKEYTRTMAFLQDKCLPTSREDVQKLFREDFGKMPEEIFAEFEYKPVAAASLAQVFRGKLKTGEEVAVKVQYTDLHKRFHSDLGTIIFLQDIIELFFKNYHFGWILRDLKKNLIQEMNFINEAKNSEKCAKDLKKFNFVHVPDVYWDYTTQRVLTQEWIDGFKVNDVDKIKQSNLNIKDIDIKLFKMFAEQIFNSGFVHADPHPGNVFVRKDPKTGEANLVLLDHGLYEELPERVRLPLCEFWEATVLRDERKMQAAAKQLKINDYMKFAEVLFQQPIRIHGGRIKTKLTETDIAYMQEVARKNFDIIMQTLKEMPRNMLFVVRNLNTIRAIGRHHGDVVDRPRVMARCAQSCVYRAHSIFGYFNWIYRRLLFEYCLWCNSFKLSILNLYLNVLHTVGRAPESAKSLLSNLGASELS